MLSCILFISLVSASKTYAGNVFLGKTANVLRVVDALGN